MNKNPTFRLILKDSENRAVSVDIDIKDKYSIKDIDALIDARKDLIKEEEKAKEQSEKNDKDVSIKNKKEQEKKQDLLKVQDGEHKMTEEEFLDKYPEERQNYEVEKVVEPSKPKKKLRRKDGKTDNSN